MNVKHWVKVSFFILLILAGNSSCRRKNIKPADEVQVESSPADDGQSPPAFTVHDIETVPDADVFRHILSLFKGKPVLIDFWATWCGPCRMANEELKPVKAELAGKDIVYVFIDGENSPLGAWKNMIQNLHGEHFRLSQSQWNYMGEKLNLNAVPTYFFIDREGNIKEIQAGYPGVEKMREQILQIVNE